MSFLPDDYAGPPSTGRYMKLSGGANKFRILGSAVVGNLFWITLEDGSRKALRKKMGERMNLKEAEAELGQTITESNPPKHFWAFPVWSFEAGMIQILEITQSTIQQPMTALTKDAEWGDPDGYNITINKSGQKLDTEYSVIPSPPSALPDECVAAMQTDMPDMDALWTGEDPFAHLNDDNNAAPADAIAQAAPSKAEPNTLDDVLVKSITAHDKGGKNIWLVEIEGQDDDFGVTSEEVSKTLAEAAENSEDVCVTWEPTPKGGRLITCATMSIPF